MRRFTFFTTSLLLGAGSLYSQSGDRLPKFGIGLRASSLGAGIEAATAVSRKSNVRFGFNYFRYDGTYTKDGVAYSGRLDLKSFEIHYDQYLIGGLHISPGTLVYDDNRGSATVSIPGGQSSALIGSQYYSSVASPVAGSGSLAFPRKTAPELLIGFGNLLPRSRRHVAFNFEAGVAYQGSPGVTFNLAGTACDSTGKICQNIAANPTIQANIVSEQNKINRDRKSVV